MTDPSESEWAPLPGWGQAYQVELHSGRCRSIDRHVVSTTGQRRFLRGVNLLPCGPSGVVTLSHKGARRVFTARRLRELATAHQDQHTPTTGKKGTTMSHSQDDLQKMADTTVVITHTEDFELYGPVRHSETLHVSAPIANYRNEEAR